MADVFSRADCYVLRITGDSMIEDSIVEGDFAVMRTIKEISEAKDGDVVAARVPDYGTTLKRFYKEGNKVTLQPANARYESIRLDADTVEVQGVLIAIWRDIGIN